MPLLYSSNSAELATNELNRVKKRMNKTQTTELNNFQSTNIPTPSQVSQVYQNLLIILQKLNTRNKQILDFNLPIKELLKLFIEGGVDVINDTNYIINNVLPIYNFFTPQQELFIKKQFSELRSETTILQANGNSVIDDIQNGDEQDLEDYLNDQNITLQEYEGYGKSILTLSENIQQLVDAFLPYVQQYNYMRTNARPATSSPINKTLQGGHIYRSSNDPRIYPELRFL